MSDSVQTPERVQPPACPVLERMRDAARAAASWDVVERSITAGSFPERIESARSALRHLEVDLASLPAAAPAEADRSAALENAPLLALRENLRLLRLAIATVSNDPRVVARLPRIILNEDREEPRVAAAAEIYLKAVDSEFSAETFCSFISELQIHEPLTSGELWSFAGFLKFALLELLLAEANSLLRAPSGAQQSMIPIFIKSLRVIGRSDWVAIVEQLIAFDATLRQDPAGVYGCMDFESRELYRKRVAFIARHSDHSESGIALMALELASEALQLPSDDPRIYRRRIHVGYYLVDSGFSQLAARVGYHPPPIERLRGFIRREASDIYIASILLVTTFLIAALLFPLLPNHTIGALAATIALMLLPVMQDAVELVNSAVTVIFDPQPLPKFDFSKGIPADRATVVAIPTLLLNPGQVRKLVADLEARFLANRDPHLHFALVTDLPDSASKPRENDSHPLVELAVELITELNAKYASKGSGSFFLLHRHRIFNSRQGVWMGWERKRGKLLDLNKLLLGGNDAFPIKAGKIERLEPIRYVLTLDSDTQLPRGTAAQLIGAMAHPLNEAVIDPKTRIVNAGYGILQPRIGITVQSAARSRLASIYSGQSGFDIYTRAVSDAYQELVGEGSFTGKGIYEVAIFNTVLEGRFPRNALLSHDLIEGAYARAGLAADIELIDDYPSHYSAYVRRKHRWVRGDWQIAQWMFSIVPEEFGALVTNPISAISRWKIFDNLRRSLVEPFTFILFVAGWLGLPGGPLYWTILLPLLIALPAFIMLCMGLCRALASDQRGRVSETFAAFARALLVALLDLIFLPHQTLLTLDAIVRSLVRRFVTGKRLLEWETAAQTEDHSPGQRPVDNYLVFVPFVVFGLAILISLVAPQRDSIFFAAPILLLWALAYPLTAWLNKPPREEQLLLESDEEQFLLAHALFIWRYFYEFGGERHNYLIPDNVEEEGLFEAARVSPTNLGLLLNARQAACELGFLTAPEYAALTRCSLATIAKLEKHRGHLYNWYNTQSLEPVSPVTVSSVDSGNLVACLYTVRAGTLSMCQEPLITQRLFAGIRTHWRLLQLQRHLPAQLARISLPDSAACMTEWISWLPAAHAALCDAAAGDGSQTESPWWLAETKHRVASVLTLLHDYTPWLLPEYERICESPQLELKQNAETSSIDAAIAFSELLELSLASGRISNDSPLRVPGEQLRATLPRARQNLRALAAELRAIADQIEVLAEETEFGFLIEPNRQLLSVGYDVAEQKLHPACYDMLASEARIATFLAVARGDLPQQSWFKLARDHTRAFDQILLLSWTGTMFEYLMPGLWMRSYPDTLIARTQAACVQVHRSFAGSLNIPWGISESGYSCKDEAGHYHYQAFGIPQIALKFDATAGPTVSPYSTFLALGVESRQAVRNLRRMAKAGWVGAYGLYEAADYAHSPGKPVIVREWMAHHQGMSLLAILNLLHGNIVQRWFHSNPLIQSAELLLNELPAHSAVLEAMAKEFAPIAGSAGKAA